MDSITSVAILFIASILIWIMALGAVLIWLSGKNAKKGMFIKIAVSILLAAVTSQTIKVLFPYPRPYEVYGLDPLTLTTPFDSSFPSTHTAIAFALAFSLYKYHKKYGYLFFVGAFFVALGRITSQVHFVGDVAGGVLIGYFAHKFADVIINRKKLRA